MITCPSSDLKPVYTCYYCNRSFDTQEALDAHGKTCLVGRAVGSVGRAWMWWQQRKPPKPPVPGGPNG